MTRKILFISRPFHGDTYDTTIYIPANGRISIHTYNRIFDHGDCKCQIQIVDANGTSYGVIPSIERDYYEVFEV